MNNGSRLRVPTLNSFTGKEKINSILSQEGNEKNNFKTFIMKNRKNSLHRGKRLSNLKENLKEVNNSSDSIEDFIDIFLQKPNNPLKRHTRCRTENFIFEENKPGKNEQPIPSSYYKPLDIQTLPHFKQIYSQLHESVLKNSLTSSFSINNSLDKINFS